MKYYIKMLHETRIVLTEKVEKDNFLGLLGVIDEEIKSGARNYIVSIYFPAEWLNYKLIRKVLEDNGFRILKDKKGLTYVKHNRYIDFEMDSVGVLEYYTIKRHNKDVT